MNNTNPEDQLVRKLAKAVLVIIMNSNDNLINYGDIEKETQVPTQIIRTVASQICKCLITSTRVDDADCVDDSYFDVILKSRTAKG